MPENKKSSSPFVITERIRDQQGRAWLFSEDEAIKQLPTIERMIKGLSSLPTNKRSLDDEFIEDTVPYGRLKGNKVYRVRQDSRFQQIRSSVKTLLKLRSKNYSLSHHAHAFTNHFYWCVMEEWEKDKEAHSRHMADEAILLLDQSISFLNREINSDSFKAKVKNANELGKQRTKSLKSWMKKAFRRSPGLLLIHLQVSRDQGREPDFEEAANDRKSFFSNWRRNPLFHYLVGYIFKLHFHPQKGVVHDILLFYDAVMVREFSSLTNDLEQFWLNITWDKSSERSLGKIWHEDERLHLPRSHEQQKQTMPYSNRILMPHGEENEQRLKDIIFYLSYYDTFLSYHLPSNTRTLGTNELTKRKKRTPKKQEPIKTQSDSNAPLHVPIDQPMPPGVI